MPRYHFDVFDGSKTMVDDFGDVFLDDEDPTAQAISLLLDFSKDIAPGDGTKDFGVAVRDEGGRGLYRAALIFRDDHPNLGVSADLPDVCPAFTVPDPIDLIRQARESIAEAEAIRRQVLATAAGLADLLRRTAETMRQVQATMAAVA